MNEVLDILSELNNIWEEYIVNYPKKYYELVIRIKREFLNLSICMLDFFLDVCYEKRIISENKCIDLGSKLYVFDYRVKELFL